MSQSLIGRVRPTKNLEPRARKVRTEKINLGRGGGGRVGVFGLVGALALGCGGAEARETEAPPASIQPSEWDAELRLQPAHDDSPDPHVFETTIVAQVSPVEILPGVLSEVYTYGGTLPGPEIRVQRGDRVIIHLVNQLPEATTVHFHGVRVPNAVDGVPLVTQPEILPGQSHTYDFVVPDAGTYWYHPHVRSAAQVGFGLYGSFVVTDPDEPADLGDELTLLLSDISLDEQGALLDPDAGTQLTAAFGHEGNIVLVNGKINPRLDARIGRRQRWRVINAARSKYFQLTAAGHDFLRFGGDGGRIDRPVTVPTLVVIPAERADVVFTPRAEPMSHLPVIGVPYDRGFGSLLRDDAPILDMVMADRDAYVDDPLPPLDRDIEPPDLSGAVEVPLELTQTALEDGTIEMGINGVPHAQATPLSAQLGETQIWTISTNMDFAHPFHLHGYFFQVLSVDGIAPTTREWKDTVDVHVGGETKIAVHFDERPGMWMFHCHILDHADLGMMSMVHVVDPNDPLAGSGGAEHQH